jgi:hypothetical protein
MYALENNYMDAAKVLIESGCAVDVQDCVRIHSESIANLHLDRHYHN